MKLAIALAMPTSNEREMLSSNEALKELRPHQINISCYFVGERLLIGDIFIKVGHPIRFGWWTLFHAELVAENQHTLSQCGGPDS